MFSEVRFAPSPRRTPFPSWPTKPNQWYTHKVCAIYFNSGDERGGQASNMALELAVVVTRSESLCEKFQSVGTRYSILPWTGFVLLNPLASAHDLALVTIVLKLGRMQV